jgi:aminoglycoside phosphotransferase (APT) family kinase protein
VAGNRPACENGSVLRPDLAHRLIAATGGFATNVWRLDTDTRSYALRVFRAHERPVLEREVAVMRAASASGIPVPGVHAIGMNDDRPALLIDWCPGTPLVEAARRQPWRLPSLAARLGRLHRHVNSVRAPAGLRSNWIDWPRAADAALSSHLQAVPMVHDRLLHMDFHPLNVLAQNGHLSAVLDWTNAHAGDPRADFARTVSILRLAPPLDEAAQRIARGLFEAFWRLGYGSPGRDMAAFYAWAGAALVHDLADRFAPAELEPARRWTDSWRQRLQLR